MHVTIQRRWLAKGDRVFDSKFMENVHWAFKVYQPVCQHIVWIGNTANGNEDNSTMYSRKFTQTMENMKQIDLDVKDVIEADSKLNAMVSFIDVHDASLFAPHSDFVHMDNSWCRDLGNWLSNFAMNVY